MLIAVPIPFVNLFIGINTAPTTTVTARELINNIAETHNNKNRIRFNCQKKQPETTSKLQLNEAFFWYFFFFSIYNIKDTEYIAKICEKIKTIF